MEPAIAPALACPRSQASRIAPAYAPPFPAWTTRAGQDVEQVVMAYCGVQSFGDEHRPEALAVLDTVIDSFGLTDGPRHHDLAHDVDAAGYDNWIAVAYWSDFATFARWRAAADVDGWWTDPARLTGPIGVFREILLPTLAAFETLFSAADRLEGVGVTMQERSVDAILEHGYWGSMRDRLPLAQTDTLAPSDELRLVAGAPGHGHRARLRGNHQLAVIRSGQDWTDTTGRERTLYLEEMEPVLRSGMAFLRDEGRGIDCYSNRYMRAIDAAGIPIEKSFGYSHWRSLAALEQWAEHHPTHIAIFGTFMGIVQDLQSELKLRLYHEVSVLGSAEQDYEYVNCHPRTGLLAGLDRAA